VFLSCHVQELKSSKNSPFLANPVGTSEGLKVCCSTLLPGIHTSRRDSCRQSLAWAPLAESTKTISPPLPNATGGLNSAESGLDFRR